MSSPGETLHKLRERKPLIHQITNYVVMNERRTRRSQSAALPVLAHAGGRRGWRDGVISRGARPQHRDALATVDRRDAARGRAANARGTGRRSTRSASARPGSAPRHGEAHPRRGRRRGRARQRGRDAALAGIAS